MKKNSASFRCMVLLACITTLGACATTPWKVDTVTLKSFPSSCNAITGFLNKDGAPAYVPSAAVNDPFLHCAIAEVTIVPSGSQAPAGQNIFLFTTFTKVNNLNPPNTETAFIADYQLPAPFPGNTQKQVFDVIAAMSAATTQQFENSNIPLTLYLGNNIDVANEKCTVSIAAQQISCGQ